MGDAGATAELLWSSAERLEYYVGGHRYEKELCGLINLVRKCARTRALTFSSISFIGLK